METINVQKIIEMSENYEVALFTTFTIDLSFAEKAIINRLYENGCRHISVFVDENQFSDHIISLPEIDSLGEKYTLHTVETNAAFHSKLILLLGKSSAKLLVGSGNLTTAGLVSNYEYFTEFEYIDPNRDALSIIQSAYNLFRDLFIEVNRYQSNLAYIDEDLIDRTKNYDYLYENATNPCSSSLLNNLNSPIITQVLDKIDDDVVAIDICVPYFDQDLRLLSVISKLTNHPRISLFIQADQSNFPVALADNLNDHNINSVNIFEFIHMQGMKSSVPKRYHGKLFRFRTKYKEYLLYGSPNCSVVAMARSFRDAGNFETAVIVEGKTNQYNRYFDDLVIIGNTCENLRTIKQENSTTHNNPIKIINTVSISEIIICTIIAKADVSIKKATIDNIEGEVTTDGNIIKIKFNSKNFSLIGPLYTIKVETIENNYDLVGWLCYPELILNNRRDTKKNAIGRISAISDLDDSQVLFDIIEQCLDEMNMSLSMDNSNSPHYQTKAAVRSENIVEVSGVNENVDEYFVDDETFYAKFRAKNQLRDENPFSYLAKLFFEEFSDVSINDKDHSNKNQSSNESSSSVTIQNVGDYMQKFIQRYISAINSKKYVEHIDISQLLDNTIILIRLYWRVFQECESAEKHTFSNLYTFQYASNLYLEIAKAISNNAVLNTLDNNRQTFILSTILTSIACNYELIGQLEDSGTIERIQKEINRQLSYLDKSGIDFRDNYSDYFDLICRDIQYIWPEPPFSESQFCNSIESLFKYKSWNQILLYLVEKYNNAVEQKYDKSELTYVIITDEPAFRHDLPEYKMALQTMTYTLEPRVNFVFMFTSSKVYSMMKVTITGPYTNSIVQIWKKTGDYKKSTIKPPSA